MQDDQKIKSPDENGNGEPKSKWMSRKLAFAVSMEAILALITLFKPDLASSTLPAMTWIAGIYLGAQGLQNALEKFGGSK